MATLFRWLFRLVTAGLVLSLAAALLLWWFLSRSIPDYDTRVAVAGLAQPVEIVRDNANVPHVFGADDAGVFFGLGYVHAQDRLWQMTMLRRTAQGRLSELFGRRTFGIDELLRRLDLYPLAVAAAARQEPEVAAALRAYSDGVNAWLDEVNAGARGRGAPEFWLFPPDIAPWTPADSVALVKLMALRLTGHAGNEVLRARMLLRLPEAEEVDEILPAAPGPAIAALPQYAGLPGAVTTAARDPLDPVPPAGMGGASNAWAAAPSRSASGGTLLANDPHLGFSAPSLWYLARLELASGGVIGGTIPGIPAILLGRSERIAWGLTATGVDDQDIHLEQLDPDDPTRAMTPGGWAKMPSRPSIIRIKDEAPQTITLRWSENGPVLGARQYDLGLVTPPDRVASLSWTALMPDDTSIGAAIRIMQAQSIEEALAAGEAHVAPAQNLTVIDRERIAMKTIGVIPRRDPAHATRGRHPSAGWIAANRWDGRMPYADNPEFIDPAGGIVGNTNNKLVNRPFPDHVTYDWGDTQRVMRWRGLMQEREVHTRDSFIEAQLDTVSYTAQSLLPLIAGDLWFPGEPAPEGTPERRRQDAMRLLSSWNGEMNEHMPEPLIYSVWMMKLQDRLIRDELGGDLAAEFAHLQPVFVERVFRDIGGAGDWCDVRPSARVETCAEIAQLALDDALQWIEETIGTDLAALRWGDVHEARHDHEVLGEQPVLRWLVNVRQSVSGGDNTLMRTMSRSSGEAPFAAVHGAGYRGVYDLADPDSSVFVTATGQSGHPLSRHYDDLGELWRRGEYIPMSLDPALARAAAVGITRLDPR